MRYLVFIICMAMLLTASACLRDVPKTPYQPPAPSQPPADNDDTYVPMNYYY